MATRTEQRIMRNLLSDTMPYDEAAKALQDPDAWKHQRTGFKNDNRWRTDIIHTPRGTVYWVWTKHRNAAGYFIGSRIVTDKDGKKTEDEIIARRIKKRLGELQKSKAAKLKAKYPDQAAVIEKKAIAAKKARAQATRVPHYSPKPFSLFCTIIAKDGKTPPKTHRVGGYENVGDAKGAMLKEQGSVPPSLRLTHDRYYRLYRATWTKAAIPEFSLS